MEKGLESEIMSLSFKDKADALSFDEVLPVKATSSDKILPIKYPLDVQPKLDGMRYIITIGPDGYVSDRTRLGNSMVELAPFILEQVLEKTAPLAKRLNHSILLDGELYVHGKTFSQIMSLCKKDTPESRELLEYHLYDILYSPSVHTPNKTPWADRKLLLQDYFTNTPDQSKIKHVKSVTCFTEEERMIEHEKIKALGYEGTIGRYPDFIYEPNKKSQKLIKFKDFVDEAFLVLDAIPGDKMEDQAKLVLKAPEGALKPTFEAALAMTHKEREEVLLNKENYIGQTAEVRFLEYSEYGIPRNAVCVGFRLDKIAE